MTRAEWEEGDANWQNMIAKDKTRARKTRKAPNKQCCFGIAQILGPRCPNPATRASTFYGYTHGTSWCDQHGHGDRVDDYPHGEIAINKS